MLARIIVAHGGEHVEERPLRTGRLLIGRTVDNDMQIDSKFVSRHHCQITTTADGSILEDLNSTNGVYVKSKRVRRHHLNDGDVVVLGKHEIMYLDERSARARGSAQESTGDHPAIEESDAGRLGWRGCTRTSGAGGRHGLTGPGDYSSDSNSAP